MRGKREVGGEVGHSTDGSSEGDVGTFDDDEQYSIQKTTSNTDFKAELKMHSLRTETQDNCDGDIA